MEMGTVRVLPVVIHVLVGLPLVSRLHPSELTACKLMIHGEAILTCKSIRKAAAVSAASAAAAAATDQLQAIAGELRTTFMQEQARTNRRLDASAR
eukprot:7595068-Pyramimonas_sp.AAC.1